MRDRAESGSVALITGGGTGLGLEIARVLSARGYRTAIAAAWLVSEEAAYVTGECITLDGGAWLGKGVLGEMESIPKVRRRRRRDLGPKNGAGE